MNPEPHTDRFGNPLDPVVGFARGGILRASVDEARRLRQGQRLAAERVRRLGPESIGIFTGNQRDFPLQAADLNTHCEEWVGPGLFAQDLRRAAIAHLGGTATDGAAVVNRTSAGLIAAIVALAEGKAVVSVVPPGGRSHASVTRGCRIAGVALHEVAGDQDWQAAIDTHAPALVIVTTVTSSLECLDDACALAVCGYARPRGARVLLDEAYGARMRPVLRGGAPSLQLGADISITNCDKAGLSGPRAGLLAGREALVLRVLAQASEFGMEARAPIAASALRSIERFRPQDLLDEAHSGQELARALQVRLGTELVAASDLGPVIAEDDALTEVLRRAQKTPTDVTVTPAEITSAIGMLLLRDAGVLTVNTHGQPGARVSLRFKPTHGAIARVGGLAALVDAVDRALFEAARYLDDTDALARLIVGDAQGDAP